MSRARFVAEEIAAVAGVALFSIAVVVICGALSLPLPRILPARPTAHAAENGRPGFASGAGRMGSFDPVAGLMAKLEQEQRP